MSIIIASTSTCIEFFLEIGYLDVRWCWACPNCARKEGLKQFSKFRNSAQKMLIFFFFRGTSPPKHKGAKTTYPHGIVAIVCKLTT